MSMRLRYQQSYMKLVFEQIKHDYGDLTERVMGEFENGQDYNNPHYMDLFCKRIGLDEYKHYDQVIHHIRANEHLHDYWAL